MHPIEPEAVGRPGRERRDPACLLARHALCTLPISCPRHCRTASSRRNRSSFSRSASTTCAGALPTNRSFASMPSARAISLRNRSRSASTSPFARARSGRTTASKIRRSSSEPSPTRTPLRRNICAASCTWTRAPRSPAKRSSGSGHGDTIRRAARVGSCAQISSVTCGSTGCSSASSRSSAASAVAIASASRSCRRGLIASAYQSQKSSKVRW